jgi:hypothetical protein
MGQVCRQGYSGQAIFLCGLLAITSVAADVFIVTKNGPIFWVLVNKHT